jgi:hypothetical protein
VHTPYVYERDCSGTLVRGCMSIGITPADIDGAVIGYRVARTVVAADVSAFVQQPRGLRLVRNLVFWVKEILPTNRFNVRSAKFFSRFRQIGCHVSVIQTD